nr:MAG TPA: hypothetical protein [Bacteriophage sp.]
MKPYREVFAPKTENMWRIISKHGYLVCLRVLSLYLSNNCMCTVQDQLVSALC